jgi:E3 ubiquitin-protein ligase DOA10
MFSNDKNIETIGQLVEQIKHYLTLQSNYIKLDAVEKIVRLITTLLLFGVFAVLVLIALVFFSIALANALSQWCGLTLALCIVGGLYILLLILAYACRHKCIEKPLVRFLTSLLSDADNN